MGRAAEPKAEPVGVIKSVIPAKAGIQVHKRSACRFWIPASAGITIIVVIARLDRAIQLTAAISG